MVFLFRLISRSRNIYHSLPTSFNHSRPGASEKLSNTNIACLYILTAYTILVNRGNSLCRYNDTSLKIVRGSQFLIDIKLMIICIIHYLFDLIQGSFPDKPIIIFPKIEKAWQAPRAPLQRSLPLTADRCRLQQLQHSSLSTLHHSFTHCTNIGAWSLGKLRSKKEGGLFLKGKRNINLDTIHNVM